TKLERKKRLIKCADNYGQSADNNGRYCPRFGHLSLLQPPFSSRGRRSKLAPAMALSETLAGIGGDWQDILPISATDAIIWFRYGILIEQTIRQDFRCKCKTCIFNAIIE